jgi:hypothetical protein
MTMMKVNRYVTDYPVNIQDAYFIALTDYKHHYIHLHYTSEKKVVYVVREGLVGAAVWTMENAKKFIKHTGAGNLQLIGISAAIELETGHR